jgi:hypothetical protein
VAGGVSGATKACRRRTGTRSGAREAREPDINAAAQAREAGEERLISLSRSGVRLNARHLAELRTAIEDLIQTAREHPDEDGVWTTVLWTAVDREDRATTGKE